MADPAAPHRRFQFRLRTLLLVVTALAIICAVGVPLLQDWLKPPETVEPWLPVDAFTNTTLGKPAHHPIEGGQFGGLPPSHVPVSPGAPVPVSAPTN